MNTDFSYEHYMNLVWHLDHAKETVPTDIAKRIISHAMAPVITVTSTLKLDDHIKNSYNGVNSLYDLLKYFGGCVSDRDQTNELRSSSSKTSNHLNIPQDPTSSTSPSVVVNRKRSNSNSLLQRDPTQLQYIRFSKPLPDLLSDNSKININTSYNNDNLEIYLKDYLSLINNLKPLDSSMEHRLFRNSIYHNFFAQAISSTTNLSPFESFNHPIISLIALDITMDQSYEDARDLLTTFKNLNKFIENFPQFLSINDILPVFLLCYDNNSKDQLEIAIELSKKLKKHLFVESLLLPLWNGDNNSEPENNPLITLHQPIMTSIDETLIFLQDKQINDCQLPLNITNHIYDMLDNLVHKLLLPFIQRKISFWDETIMQPRKSIFHGSKFLKRFINKNNSQEISTYKDLMGNEQFLATSMEFQLRKLADWSMMTSNFKMAFLTYNSLLNDLDNFPVHKASALEWCAISLLMGAQNIVTVKMIKNDITPLISNAVEIYKSVKKTSYETRCMILSSELFLSLSDSWTSTPYAITYLETILSDGNLGSCSQILIWERLSDCYQSRIDPRIKHLTDSYHNNNTKNYPMNETSDRNMNNIVNTTTTTSNNNIPHEEIVSKGFTRKRKAAFFRLIAAKKWAEQNQWTQVGWCLSDIKEIYSKVGLFDRSDLILHKLNEQFLQNQTKNLKI